MEQMTRLPNAMVGQPLERAERERAQMRGVKALQARAIVCRHGATDYPSDQFYARGDGPSLNPAGVAQAEALGRWFATRGETVEALYVSPSLRTRQTAAPIEQALAIPATVVEGLTERSVGRWDGRFVDDIRREDSEGWRRWKSEPVTFAPPEGESLVDFVERIDSTLTALIHKHPGGTIVLVTHVGPIRAMLGSALGCPPEHGKRFVIEPGSVTCIDYTSSWPNLVLMGFQPSN